MAEEFHHHPGMHAGTEQQTGRGVAAVVQANLADPGRHQQTEPARGRQHPRVGAQQDAELVPDAGAGLLGVADADESAVGAQEHQRPRTQPPR